MTEPTSTGDEGLREAVEGIAARLHASGWNQGPVAARDLRAALAAHPDPVPTTDSERVAKAWDEGWAASEQCESDDPGMCGDCDLCNAPNPYRRAARVEGHWCTACGSHTSEHAHASYDDRAETGCSCRGCAPVSAADDTGVHPHAKAVRDYLDNAGIHARCPALRRHT